MQNILVCAKQLNVINVYNICARLYGSWLLAAGNWTLFLDFLPFSRPPVDVVTPLFFVKSLNVIDPTQKENVHFARALN